MGYENNFKNLLNKSENIRKTQAEGLDKYLKSKEYVDDVQGKFLSASNSTMDKVKDNAESALESVGIKIKESNQYSVYMYIEKASIGEDVDLPQDYNIKIDGFFDVLSDGSYINLNRKECTLEIDSIIYIKISAFAPNGISPVNIPVKITMCDLVPKYILFKNDLRTITEFVMGEEYIPIHIKKNSEYTKANISTDIIIAEMEGVVGALETYDYKIKKTHPTEGGVEYIDYKTTDLLAAQVLRPEILSTFLNLKTVRNDEVMNILKQITSNPEYTPLIYPLQMRFITSLNATSMISYESPYPDYNTAAGLSVKLVKEIIDTLVDLDNFRKNIATVLANLDYDTEIDVDLFKFSYDINFDPFVSSAPVKYDVTCKYKSNNPFIVKDKKGNVNHDLSEYPEDKYGSLAGESSLSTYKNITTYKEFVHYLFDHRFGAEYVDATIAKHEKLATDGPFFGITGDKLSFGISKGIVSLANSQLDKYKKKLIAEMNSDIDKFNMDKGVNRAIKTKNTIDTLTGTEKFDKKEYFDNLKDSLKDDVEVKKKLDHIKKNIESLDNVNFFKYKTFDGVIDLLLPFDDTSFLILTRSVKTITKEDGVYIDEVKKLFKYNTLKDIIEEEYLKIENNFKEYTLLQEDIIRYLNGEIMIVLNDSTKPLERLLRIVTIPYINKKVTKPSVHSLTPFLNKPIYNYISYEENSEYRRLNSSENLIFKINDIIKVNNDDKSSSYIICVDSGIQENDGTVSIKQGINGMALSSRRYIIMLISGNGVYTENISNIAIFKSNNVINKVIDKAIMNIQDINGIINAQLQYTSNKAIRITVRNKPTYLPETFEINNLGYLHKMILNYFGVEVSLDKVDVVSTQNHISDYSTQNRVISHYPFGQFIIGTNNVTLINGGGSISSSISLKENEIYFINESSGIESTTERKRKYLKYSSYIGSDKKYILQYLLFSRDLGQDEMDNNMRCSLYKDGDIVMNEFYKNNKSGNTTDKLLINNDNKVKSLLSDVKPDSIKLDISLKAEEPTRTITINSITLSKSANLKSAIDTQVKMYSDILNDFKAAKDKQDAVSNRKSKYLVTKFTPKK